MVNNQIFLFLIFIIDGILIGMLFDFFRILRKTFKTIDLITYIEDVFFWIITGIIILYSMYNFCDGELRFFMILGIILGVSMYILIISRYIMRVSISAINIFKKIFGTVIKIIAYPFMIIYKTTKKIIFRPLINIFNIIRKYISNLVKKMKEKRGFLTKKENIYNI